MYELNELWNMIGDVDERDRVSRLWTGLSTEIQRELWKKELNPETSSFKEVQSAAEIIEIAHSVPMGRDKRSGNREKSVTALTANASSPVRGPRHRGTNPPPKRGRERPVGGKRWGARLPETKSATKGPTVKGISPEERERRRTEGRCFICGELGHVSRQCPKNTHLKSDSPGKPPGIPSFGVHVGTSDEDRMRRLAEVSEPSDDLFVGSVGLFMEGPFEMPSVDPQEDEPSVRFRDPVARRAEDILQGMHFPWDDNRKNEHLVAWNDPDRFWVAKHKKRDWYVVEDYHHHGSGIERMRVSRQRLENPEFRIDRAYWLHLGRYFSSGLQGWDKRLLYKRERQRSNKRWPMGTPIEDRVEWWLEEYLVHPEDYWSSSMDRRFVCERISEHLYCVTDNALDLKTYLPRATVLQWHWNPARWYRRRLGKAYLQFNNDLLASNDGQYDGLTELFSSLDDPPDSWIQSILEESISECVVYGVQVAPGRYPALQRNSATTRDMVRAIPKPIVVVVHVDGRPARALIDTGSLADFMSLTTAEQLKCRLTLLAKPLTIQLAVQGSRSKVNYGAEARFQYQGTDYRRYFDVINLQNYDLILGTPFLYQHSVTVGFNSPRVILGSTDPLPLKGSGVTTLESRAVEVLEVEVENTRKRLIQLARPLCTRAADTGLPPLRAINHTIPLIDEGKIYPWRPSRCPEPMRPQWAEKRKAYLASGRWQVTSAGNTVPMLFIRKPGTDRLRTVVDLRERNKNTRKLTSPLPDMEGILRRVARRPFRSLMDGQDAYEQIRVIPEHVPRTAMTTPDGNMVSHVLQQGDCNAPATYQAVMNYLFGEYIGIFMDVYLDDIIIYSDSLAEHIVHVQKIVQILEREQLFLSEKKLKFLQPEMRILGRIVSNDGIRMDPDKVDSVLKWKSPTNRDLCRGFIGAVGYLADDIHRVRIPLGVLSAVCGDTVPFRWDDTEQRAFEEVKRYVSACSSHSRVPLTYVPGHPQIWMMTDACPTGVGGVIAQGADWRKAKVAAFYSAKLNAAQRNYPVHEQELLAGVETMLRHRDILQGCPFTWLTDHKSLTHLLSQKNLSGRQARWMEKLGEFDFTVEYLPGAHNILPDALSRMYDFDAPGTVRATSEYVANDEDTPPLDASGLVSMPVLVGEEAKHVEPRRSSRIAGKVVVATNDRLPPKPVTTARRAHNLSMGARQEPDVSGVTPTHRAPGRHPTSDTLSAHKTAVAARDQASWEILARAAEALDQQIMVDDW